MNTIIYILDIVSKIFPRKLAQKFSKLLGLVIYKSIWRNDYFKVKQISKQYLPDIDNNVDIALGSLQSLLSSSVDYAILANQSKAKTHKLIQGIKVVGQDNLEEALNKKRPTLVISIHMGDILSGFLKLASLYSIKNTISIIKYMPETTKETKAYSHFLDLDKKIEFLRLNEQAGRKALENLKNGHIIFTLCDLPSSYSSKSQVQFLGKMTLWPNGPIKLAILAKALIIPVVCFQNQGEATLRIEKFIDTVLNNKSFSKKDHEKNILQLLINQISEWINAYPTQWHFWHIMEKLCPNHKI